jgi:hypothetical protein
MIISFFNLPIVKHAKEKFFFSIISSSTPQRVVRVYAKLENGCRRCI